MTIKTVLIDDNKEDLELLENELKDVSFIDVIGRFISPVEAIQFINLNKTDLIISDIEMPGINGINAIKLLPHPPLVIFISSHPEYALESFEVKPLHYLVKPINKEKLLKAVYRAQCSIEQKSVMLDNFIFVYVDKNYEKIMYADILFIKAEQNYVKIMQSEKSYLVLSNLSQFIKQLPESHFKRVHKSYAVNMDNVIKYNNNEILFNEVIVPISEAYKESILNALKSNTTKRVN